MRKRHLAALCLAALCLTGCGADSSASQAQTADLFAMDTYMTLKAYGAHADTALEAAKSRITALETMLSVTDPQSEVWRINHAGGAETPVSPETVSILQTARRIGTESGGALSVSLYPVLCAWGFTTGSYQIPAPETITALLADTGDSRIALGTDSVRIPAEMQIDLGALAKGFTGDAVMDIFRENGVSAGIISLGGNVQTLGVKPGAARWTVGIRDPFAPERNLGTVAVGACAVITSGSYERFFTGEDGRRYWHILDPETGYPADRGLVSVTVIGQSGTECDALSTALFAEGTEAAAAHWQKRRDFDMILVTDEPRILVTAGISADFTPQTAYPVGVLT